MTQEINIGAISEALNNKVDLNQLNSNVQGKSYVSSLSFPSNKYLDLELGANGSTYTAPANGWFTANCTLTNSQYFRFSVLDENGEILYAVRHTRPYTNSDVDLLIPILKGNKLFVQYNSFKTLYYFRFIYAEGEE